MNSLSFPGISISSNLGNKYMCLKLSMAINGKSCSLLPKWCSGCANFLPSAVKKLIDSKNRNTQQFWTTLFLNALTFLWQKFVFNNIVIFFYIFRIIRSMEKNQERQTFFSKLLRVFKCNFPNQRNTFLLQEPSISLLNKF